MKISPKHRKKAELHDPNPQQDPDVQAGINGYTKPPPPPPPPPPESPFDVHVSGPTVHVPIQSESKEGQTNEIAMKTDKNAQKDSPISGKLDHKPMISGKSKTVCYWDGKAYSPGSEIQKGKRTYICNDDGTWGWVETK